MEHQSCNWNLVIKVKYGNVLKRFNTFVKESRLDYNMAKLRSKIKDAFNLDLDADLVLTYEDEDGDVITMEQEEDLIDAAIYQQLNPLRIEAQLRNPSSEVLHSVRNMSMSSDSKSANGPAMQESDPLRSFNMGRIGDINRSCYSDHCGYHSSPHVCGPRPKQLKLKSRFVQDVTIPDGTRFLPSTSFTKIWRMCNNGKDIWPYGTQLVCVGGDQIADSHAVQLQIPPTGFPVQENIDVQVEFVAPLKPGRYISFWRLASPSGKKFGHCFWVMFEVELPSTDTGNSSSSLDLDQPPDNKYARAGSFETLEDQVTHQVTKIPATVSSSQRSNKTLIDLSEDGQYANLTVNLGNNKELVSESDQLLAELHDMGFSDEELNRRLLVEHGGSIKKVVLNLVAREKWFSS